MRSRSAPYAASDAWGAPLPGVRPAQQRPSRQRPQNTRRSTTVAVPGDLAVKDRAVAAEMHCGLLTTGCLVSEGDMETCEAVQAKRVSCEACHVRGRLRVHGALETAPARTLETEVTRGVEAVRSVSAQGGACAGFVEVWWAAPVAFACGQEATVRVVLPRSDTTEDEGALVVALSATEGGASADVLEPESKEPALAITLKRRVSPSTRVCWIGARLFDEDHVA